MISMCIPKNERLLLVLLLLILRGFGTLMDTATILQVRTSQHSHYRLSEIADALGDAFEMHAHEIHAYKVHTIILR